MSELVSVVIPTCRREKLLVRAIESVLRQTYVDMEILVVVDGPDEATHEALRGISDARLRVIGLAKSVGGSDARNVGVAHAKSEWIAFLDDDDEWLPTKLEKQMALAAQASEPYPVIATQLIAKSSYGEFIWPRRFPEESEPLCDYLFSRKSFFAGEGLLQTSSVLTRKALMELVPFTSGLPKHQDIDWYVRASLVTGARFRFVHEPLVIFYVEQNRATLSTRSDWRFSLNWLKASRARMSPRAYAGFISSIVASEASKQGQWKAFPELLGEMLRNGKPGFMDLSLFVGRWFIRPSLRGKLRGLRHSIAVKQPA
jgi:glycosyltransferase involved in cell wall biosynthesis